MKAAASPLVWADDLDAPLAWSQGRPLSRRQYLADVQALAARLPPQGQMLNLSGDRYRFAVGIGAAMLRGQHNLMPPNHTPDMVVRLRESFPQAYAVGDPGAAALPSLPGLRHAEGLAPVSAGAQMPLIPESALVAQVFTSGSTGRPVPHPKFWGAMHLNMRTGARALAQAMGRESLAGVNLVATVPAQHMFGFESSVLVALLAGAAFDCERPFYPADIVAALARMPRPRLLVTTPFHLKMLLESGLALPSADLVLCATAPLPPQLAARAEDALSAPLLEIYGCTEAGQVATRRTTAGAEWQALDGLRLDGNGVESTVRGGHVSEPTPLADVLEVLEGGRRFRLLGRSADLINIAGKRSSLGHLNFHLNAVPGVDDGAFWLPPAADDGTAGAGVIRPVAFVVAPRLPAGEAQARVLQALRQRVDAAFLPRRVVLVDGLPREPSTGKLPAQRFSAWARAQLGEAPAEAPAAPAGPAPEPTP